MQHSSDIKDIRQIVFACDREGNLALLAWKNVKFRHLVWPKYMYENSICFIESSLHALLYRMQKFCVWVSVS